MPQQESMMPDPKLPPDAASDPEDEGHGSELAKEFQQIEDEMPIEGDPKPSAPLR
jgi:hypothetical protein